MKIRSWVRNLARKARGVKDYTAKVAYSTALVYGIVYILNGLLPLA